MLAAVGLSVSRGSRSEGWQGRHASGCLQAINQSDPGQGLCPLHTQHTTPAVRERFGALLASTATQAAIIQHHAPCAVVAAIHCPSERGLEHAPALLGLALGGWGVYMPNAFCGSCFICNASTDMCVALAGRCELRGGVCHTPAMLCILPVVVIDAAGALPEATRTWPQGSTVRWFCNSWMR